jgi:hypothetical protein
MRLLLYKIVLLILSTCFVVGLGGNVSAGVIRISLKTTLSISNGVIQTKIVATNTGTDAAHRLRGVLHIFDRTIISDKIERLGVQKAHTFDMKIELPKDKKGVYPFIGAVRFHDANQHPFSALSAGTFKVKSRLFKGVKGTATNPTVKRKGKLEMRVTNTSANPISMRATLYLPDALSASESKQKIFIASKEAKDFSFDLNNRFGAGGAKYPAFCTLEYNVNGHHQTILMRSVIRIQEAENWFIATKWYWLAGLPVLLVGWIGIGVWAKGNDNY